MNQPARTTFTLWMLGAIVLIVSFGIGSVSGSGTYSASKPDNTHATQSYTYPGPSQDYAATPHPRSLTY